MDDNDFPDLHALFDDDPPQGGDSASQDLVLFGDDPDDTAYDPMVSPIQQPAVARQLALRLQRVFSEGALTASKWQDEVHAVSQAAAVSGKFAEALSGYKMLAPALGVATEPQASSQHVHFHGTKVDLAEQGTDALQARLQEIQRIRQQKIMDAQVIPNGET